MKTDLRLCLYLLAGTFFLAISTNSFATQPYWSSLQSTQTIERHDSLTGFDITKYELTLQVNDQTHYISGDVLAYVTAENNLTEMTYQLMGGTLAVTQVLVNNNVSQFTHSDGVIRIPVSFNPGAQFTTRVYYSGTPGLSPTPYNIGIKFNTNSFYTLSNPDAGRYWWPSYDHPWDKALIDLHITVRSDWLVAANGTRQSMVDNGNGTRTHNWILNSQVATYLVGIAAGPFVEFNQTAGTLPIQNFVLPADLADAQADFANVPEMISYFSTIYGPYPFEKYGHACVSISPYAAMEHQTMTTFGAQYITGDLTYESTVAHELTHQWYGNCVTPLTMQDVWLKESFATYSEFLWKAQHYGWTAGLAYLASSIQQYYINWENSNGPHTIYNPVYNELFAPPTYEKSASVLHMLRLKMGNAAFFTFMQTWLNSHYNGNVITSEIQAAAEQASGLDLDQFFQQWIYSPGIPSAQLTYFTDGISQAKIIGQSTSNTTTLFDIEIPLRLAGSALLDSLIIHATPLGFVNTMIMDPETDNLANLQIDPNHWVLNRGFTHHEPNFLQCLPANHVVNLQWEAFTGPFSLTGYRVWRKEQPNGTFQQIAEVPVDQLSYIDMNVQNGINYRYYITALDTDGFSSVPSNTLNATPLDFPFDWGFLVVDETRDGTGAVLSPTDQQVDDFYEIVLTGMPHAAWNLATAGAPSLSMLSHYPMVLWHSDDFSDFQIDDNINTLASYINSGGKLVVSGWKYPSALPQSWFDQWFPGVIPTLLNQPVLISAQSQSYPLLIPDPSKLSPIWIGMLSMAYVFPGASNVLYTAQVVDNLTGYGEPLAIRTDNNGTLILLGFPLYYMYWGGVQAFLHQLLPQLYPNVGNTDENLVPGILKVSCYPNPCTGRLCINLEGKHAAPLRVILYNIRGQKIRDWSVVNSQEIVWDGKDGAGELAANGIYLIKVRSGSTIQTKKITLVRQ
jgi:hypothetical protein